MSKLERKNQAKQKRQSDRHALEDKTDIFSPKVGAPRTVTVVPLHPAASAATAISSINASYRIHDEIPAVGSTCVKIPSQRTTVRYIALAPNNLFSILDACQVADFVIFVVSAEGLLDDFGDLVLTTAKAQGISHFIMVAEGLFAIEPPQKRATATEALKVLMKQRFPEQDKLRCLDASRDCATVMQWICSKTPKGISWRDERSWMFVEDIQWSTTQLPIKASGEVRLTGIVRGRNFNPDRLVYVSDWGDFQIDRIASALLNNAQKGEESIEIDLAREELLSQPTTDQDDLAELAPEEIIMEDADFQMASAAASERKGVLLDDHHYFSEDEEHEPGNPKRVPRGTSKYQSAWYLGDVSDSESDLEDMANVAGEITPLNPTLPADASENSVNEDQLMTNAGPLEYPQSEIFLDPSPDEEAAELAQYRARRREDAENDLEFPDEVELHPNILARERLARYRGLRNFRTSTWDTGEDKFYEPDEWPRLLEVSNYKTAKNRFTREALINGVKPGTRVHIYLRNVPQELQKLSASTPPIALFSLLRHEHKHTVVNYSITLNPAYPTPLKSKDQLILQCGPRRLAISPLFSQSSDTPNDVHKFERFLHSGRSAIASFVGPLIWGATPTLYFKRIMPPTLPKDQTDEGRSLSTNSLASSSSDLALIATGTSLAPSTSRIIAKRIVLTGHPYKIHKKMVTVRYMFFNSEDVQWFKALQLWTKRGRSGHFKESLGTHGYFKALFDAKINPMDAVGISLYKRIWPRRSTLWRPVGDDVVDADQSTELGHAKAGDVVTLG
ncbi:MAG: hypothetical protein M1822_005513 [Bathelium mastoideum]|nr:MAG: hypothetical protein M1822_005513 [Bathelium mastoideum]